MVVERVRAVQRIQEEMHASLMRTENVVGHAIGFQISRGEVTEKLALVALVQEKKRPEQLPSSQLLPRRIDEIPLDVVAVGHVVAQGWRAPLGSRGRYRPEIPAGVSIGHRDISAGTYGMRVRDRQTGEILLLSNNHVLANANDASIGDEILQPGPVDGGRLPQDRIATLERFIPITYLDDEPPRPMPTSSPENSLIPSQRRGCGWPIQAIANAWRRDDSYPITRRRQEPPSPPIFSYDNRLDAALARPIDAASFPNSIQEIGPIEGTRQASLNLLVRKYGRTSKLTRGRITLINATVDVSYMTIRGIRRAHFVGQIGTVAMSESGDSGSVLVEEGSNLAVGLLFAGSELRSFFTPIQTVLDMLAVRVG